MSRTIWVGAVAYDPKVVTIWEGMRRYFHEEARLPPAAAFGRRYHRLDNQPFGFAEIRGTAVFRFPHRALPSRIKRLTRNHILKKFSDRLLQESGTVRHGHGKAAA